MQVWQGLYLNADVAIKILNIDYDDPSSFSFETLLRFKSEVDFQRKLSHHPNVSLFCIRTRTLGTDRHAAARECR